MQNYGKIKNEYKNWNKFNPNFKEIFIKKYYPGLNIFSNRTLILIIGMMKN